MHHTDSVSHFTEMETNYRITENTGKTRSFARAKPSNWSFFFHSEKIAKYEIIYRETDLFFTSHRRKTKLKHFHIWYGQLSFYGYWILHYFSASLHSPKQSFSPVFCCCSLGSNASVSFPVSSLCTL